MLEIRWGYIGITNNLSPLTLHQPHPSYISHSTMANPPKQSKTEYLVKGAGDARNTEAVPWPMRWIVQQIQYLVLIMIIAIGNAIKYTFQKQKDPPRQHRKAR